MSKENRNAQLGDIYDFQYGMGNTIEDIGGDYPIYGSNGVVGFTNVYNSEDAPVIGHIGAYAGIVNWATGKHFVTYNGVICRIKKGINPRFGYYLLLHSKLQKRLRGSTQPFISYDLLDDVRIFLPEKVIQDNIASVLSALDSKIELNNRINTELEAMAKTLYDYWFVQFDFPDKNGQPYKSSGGKMVWNSELKREIPEGWGAVTIKQILAKESSTKKIQSSEIRQNGAFPVIDQSTDFIAGYTDDIESIINVEEPRIIFGDHTRILKLINFDFARGADGTQVMLSNNRRMPQHLFFHTLLKIDLSNYGYARHYKFLKDQRIILPDEAVASTFNEMVCKFYEHIKQNTFQNIELSELRDWLLPMLMNGQVKVNI